MSLRKSRRKFSPEFRAAYEEYYKHHLTGFRNASKHDCQKEILKHSTGTRHNGIVRISMICAWTRIGWVDGVVTVFSNPEEMEQMLTEEEWRKIHPIPK